MIKKTASVASTLILLWFLCVDVRAGGIVDEGIEQRYTVGAHPSVSVRNIDGRILIYGSTDGEITLKAYKRAFTKERLSRIQVNVAVSGDSMTIDTGYQPPAKGLLADRSGTVEYTLLVPQNCVIKAELSQGEILLEGLRGPSIEARLTSGRINMESCFSPAAVTLGVGGIDVVYNWWEEMPLSMSFDVGKGDVSLLLPSAAALRLDAATRSGHVRNHLLGETGAEDVQQMTTDIRGGSGATFTIRAEEGNIKIDKAYRPQ
ncbi:MAG: DUF4097 family beta strand repeat protein [Chthoniobacterales bacterium]|nr:DUF4097 family beta strand repeat protein [Chthoniobacterales bacterium]